MIGVDVVVTARAIHVDVANIWFRVAEASVITDVEPVSALMPAGADPIAFGKSLEIQKAAKVTTAASAINPITFNIFMVMILNYFWLDL